MSMKKFINNPENLVSELLEGYTLAFPEFVKLAGENLVVRKAPKEKDKVALVMLGGSGHEPALCGFVGEGMLDISISGEIFAAPGPQRCIEALSLADRDAGVLFFVLNHAGDLLTANMTIRAVQEENRNVEMFLIYDDIASGPKDKKEERRGLLGFVPIIKIAGAAAERGMSKTEIVTVLERLKNNMGTLGVAVKPPTHPSTGSSLFFLGANEMIVGVGQHGEGGTGRMQLLSADDTADLMISQLLDDIEAKDGEELLVIVNGSGATTLMELFIVYRKVHHVLTERNIKIARSLVGEYITTQEQAGFQLFIARMDAELLDLWDAPCNAPYFKA